MLLGGKSGEFEYWALQLFNWNHQEIKEFKLCLYLGK